MIEEYMNQEAVLKVKVDTDDYNMPIYAEPVTINCRFEYRTKMIRTREKQELLSGAAIYTATKIKPDDVIVYDGIEWPVLTVADQPDLDGDVVFYEGAL